uniref:Uncharacterized protein n=1 Tax=Triticum urartu TaxID=4572 RepID=A0A8R7K1K1_TRIUA
MVILKALACIGIKIYNPSLQISTNCSLSAN